MNYDLRHIKLPHAHPSSTQRYVRNNTTTIHMMYMLSAVKDLETFVGPLSASLPSRRLTVDQLH